MLRLLASALPVSRQFHIVRAPLPSINAIITRGHANNVNGKPPSFANEGDGEKDPGLDLDRLREWYKSRNDITRDHIESSMDRLDRKLRENRAAAIEDPKFKRPALLAATDAEKRDPAAGFDMHLLEKLNPYEATNPLRLSRKKLICPLCLPDAPKISYKV